jgi:hypothetical protein
MNYLHTPDLHISLISYRVREKAYLRFALSQKYYIFLRGEARHNLSSALVRIHKYHILRDL